MNLRQQNGVILLTTALILSLMTLLLLAQVELVTLHRKALNQLMKYTEILQHLEKIAQQLEKNFDLNKNCTIKAYDPNVVINQLKQQKIGCYIADDKFTYAYVIEYLGQFDCMKIKTRKKLYSSSNHWRLTIALLETQPFILQLRIVNPSVSKSKCCKQEVTILPGITSWRFLT